MKKIILSSVVITLAFIANAQENNVVKTETFKVWGNCGMCEKKIETAASKVKGVSKAEWNSDKGEMTLVYNASLTNSSAVQEAIASVGYDTEKVRASDKVYNKLHGCCQYDRKE